MRCLFFGCLWSELIDVIIFATAVKQKLPKEHFFGGSPSFDQCNFFLIEVANRSVVIGTPLGVRTLFNQEQSLRTKTYLRQRFDLETCCDSLDRIKWCVHESCQLGVVGRCCPGAVWSVGSGCEILDRADRPRGWRPVCHFLPDTVLGFFPRIRQGWNLLSLGQLESVFRGFEREKNWLIGCNGSLAFRGGISLRVGGNSITLDLVDLGILDVSVFCSERSIVSDWQRVLLQVK